MRKILLIMMAVLTVAGILFILFIWAIRAFEALNPAIKPSVVEESMDALLLSLEQELTKHHPVAIQALQPGI